MIAEALLEKNMEIVHECIFGSLELMELVTTERRIIFSEARIPDDTLVTYIQGNLL